MGERGNGALKSLDCVQGGVCVCAEWVESMWSSFGPPPRGTPPPFYSPRERGLHRERREREARGGGRTPPDPCLPTIEYGGSH